MSSTDPNQDADPLAPELIFYPYNDSGHFAVYARWSNTEICIYDKQPQTDHGMWHGIEVDNDNGKPASDLLKEICGKMQIDGIDIEEAKPLPKHEETFLRAIYGTIDRQGKDSLPAPVSEWMIEARKKVTGNE